MAITPAAYSLLNIMVFWDVRLCSVVECTSVLGECVNLCFLKMGAPCSSEMSLYICQTTKCHIQEDCNLYTQGSENLKSQVFSVCSPASIVNLQWNFEVELILLKFNNWKSSQLDITMEDNEI